MGCLRSIGSDLTLLHGERPMKDRQTRIGIDVGGTFTKAVVLDNNTLEIIGKASVLTTHSAAEGVAKGVIYVFQRALQDFDIDPRSVVFLAHSTTQATNALLEGDLAPVGIVGMGTGLGGMLAKSQTAVGDVPLVTGRTLETHHTFLNTDKLTREGIARAIQDLLDRGAKVIVATDTFSVDTPDNELRVIEAAKDLGVPATGGHDITKLYGLTIRTRTAVINAGILPKMLETATMTEASVRKAGIEAPLMIMRGDGGVMDVAEMRKRPILTMLSGPSATVAGALMYLRVSDGVFFEVGGTSTNIGVIRNGRPTIKSAEVGGHRTYVNSLDIRVLGVAGGSMVRVKGREILDVGPRSAHIAGLPYAAFAQTESKTNAAPSKPAAKVDDLFPDPLVADIDLSQIFYTTGLGLRYKTPVLAASGTFAYGVELRDVVDLTQLGGIITKGLSRERRSR